jgi:hypothetical protein
MQDSWALNELSSSQFHDVRVMKSLVEAAELVVVNRGKSFSAAVGDRVRQSAGDAFSNSKVTPEIILSGHFSATVDRCGCIEGEEILVAHDTVVFNYCWHKSVKNLGPINDYRDGKGILMHSALAMTTSGTPLGLLFASLWKRDVASTNLTAKEKAALPADEKESYKWIRSQDACQTRLHSWLDQGNSATLVGDRENDIFDVFAHPRHPSLHLLIRLTWPRKVDFDGASLKLPEALETVEPCAVYQLEVPAHPGRAQRIAKMHVKFLAVDLLAPDRRRTKPEKLHVYVVHAYELDPPSNEKPIVWTLLSTREVNTPDDALKAIQKYKRRWIIERFHYTLKTGCFNVEKLQFDDFNTLANALAFYSIAAWNVLSLLYLSRESPQAAAEDYIERDHLFILRKAVKKSIITLLEAVKAIAELAGYANYPKSPLPGVKMIWMGVAKLNNMVEGARLIAPSLDCISSFDTTDSR